MVQTIGFPYHSFFSATSDMETAAKEATGTFPKSGFGQHGENRVTTPNGGIFTFGDPIFPSNAPPNFTFELPTPKIKKADPVAGTIIGSSSYTHSDAMFPGIVHSGPQTFYGLLGGPAFTFRHQTMKQKTHYDVCSFEITTAMNETISWDQHLFMVRQMQADIDDLKDKLDYVLLYLENKDLL
jgi:hypothetical protein